jgi:two-component system phosphate regulon sensor histidine kinase PhoR
MQNEQHKEDNLSKLRSEFAANVSHELRTPLTTIKGFADILASGVVTNEEDRQRFITMISVEADRMITLVNDILRLSELQESSCPTMPCCTPILELAREIVINEAEEAEAANITLSVTGEECNAPIERARLRILLTNLIENAIKYNKPGGNVTVSAWKSGTCVSICVEDTGIGIPQEHQKRVFERFYRIDKSRSKKTGGTGLGLAIVKHIVSLYGGRIHLESQPGIGTKITIEFDTRENV